MRYAGLRVIEDQLPLVTVTARNGVEVRFAPAVLTDAYAEDLRRVLHAALPGAVVRVERVARVELNRF